MAGHRRLVAGAVCLAAAICAIPGPAASGIFSGQDRVDFVTNYIASCKTKQEKSEVNKSMGITTEMIQEYCSCNADMMADRMTMEMAKHMIENGGQPSADMRTLSTEIGGICGKQMLQKKEEKENNQKN